MKNRILKIAFFLPTLNVGGIERVFITYANSLSEFYDVEFVLCKKEGILLKELSSKVNVYNLGNVRLANSFYYLRKYLKQNRLDCICLDGFGFCFAGLSGYYSFDDFNSLFKAYSQ